MMRLAAMPHVSVLPVASRSLCFCSCPGSSIVISLIFAKKEPTPQYIHQNRNLFQGTGTDRRANKSDRNKKERTTHLVPVEAQGEFPQSHVSLGPEEGLEALLFD